MGLFVTKLRQFCIFLFILLAKIGPVLLEENGSGVSYIKAKDFLLVDEDCDESGACKFRVDFAVEELFIGSLEGDVDDFNEVVFFRGVMALLQRPVQVFSLFIDLY